MSICYWGDINLIFNKFSCALEMCASTYNTSLFVRRFFYYLLAFVFFLNSNSLFTLLCQMFAMFGSFSATLDSIQNGELSKFSSQNANFLFTHYNLQNTCTNCFLFFILAICLIVCFFFELWALEMCWFFFLFAWLLRNTVCLIFSWMIFWSMQMSSISSATIHLMLDLVLRLIFVRIFSENGGTKNANGKK